MALTATYQAALLTRQYNKTANASTKYAAQDYAYEGENLVGVISFGGMDLTGCVISGVSLTITAAGAGLGQWYEKTAYLRKSNYQNATQSGVTGLQYVGDALGTIQSPFHNNTVTLVLSGALLTSVAAYFSAGNNTLTLYNPDPHPDLPGRTYSESYFRWTDVSITVEYEEGASRPTTSASSVALGSAVTISTNRASSSQTHTLTYSFGGASGTIATNVGASASWTPPASLAAQIPNVTSGVCTITCETYYGGALTGTETCQITLTVPDTAAFRPTISAITHEDSVALPSGITGYVQGVSRPEVTITASGARGSTITAYRSVLDGATYTAASFTASRALSASGDLTLNVTVTDSRGRTATASETLTVKAYSRPAITAFSAERCNSDGSTAQRDGSRVRITAAGSVSGLDGQNTIACRVMYKLKSASAWSVGDTVTASGYAVSQTDLLLSQTFNPLQSYDIKLVLTDAFGSAETLAEIGTKTVLVDFKADGTGIAFGKVAETSGVAEFGWPLKLGTPLGVEQGGVGQLTEGGKTGVLAAHLHDGLLGHIGAVQKTHGVDIVLHRDVAPAGLDGHIDLVEIVGVRAVELPGAVFRDQHVQKQLMRRGKVQPEALLQEGLGLHAGGGDQDQTGAVVEKTRFDVGIEGALALLGLRGLQEETVEERLAGIGPVDVENAHICRECFDFKHRCFLRSG